MKNYKFLKGVTQFVAIEERNWKIELYGLKNTQ